MHGIMASKRKENPKRLLEFNRPDERYFRYNRANLSGKN